MKKFLFSLIACVSFFFNANAQVCKISESNDNVEVFGALFNNEKTSVDITVSNDSKDISANVTVTIKVTYKHADYTKEYTCKGIAKPNGSTIISKEIDPELKGWKPTSVEVISITGTKCIK